MTPPRRLRVFTASAALVIAAVIVAALMVLGSPAEQRRHRLDLRRVHDLNAITRGIDRHWLANKRLPEKLDELRNSDRTAARNDPSTGTAYEYRPIGDKNFELCAVFETESQSETYWYSDNRKWAHGRGRHCFQLNVDDAK